MSKKYFIQNTLNINIFIMTDKKHCLFSLQNNIEIVLLQYLKKEVL